MQLQLDRLQESGNLCSRYWLYRQSKVVDTVSNLYLGGALAWINRTLPVTIPVDSGKHYVDQNKSRAPRYPFEPLFRAAEVMSPDYRFCDVDVVINRNSLRKLLDFCHGRRQDSFRVDLLMVEHTLIVERCEKSATTIVRGSKDSGYGRNFEKAFTQASKGLEDSSSHHRVLSYNLGSLNIAVRFEVDAGLRDSNNEEPMRGRIKRQKVQDDGSALVEAINLLRLGNEQEVAKKSRSSLTAVISQGVGTTQSSTAEIKSSKHASVTKSMPQLWFGRTHYLIKGCHLNGIFNKIEATEVAGRFKQ